MKMNIRQLLLALLAWSMLPAWADVVPTINPTATYLTPDGEVVNESMAGSAPLTGRFELNAEDVGAYSANYEWRFYLNSMDNEPYLIRYEEDTEYTFTKAGIHYIVCYATFINGNDTILYTNDYWNDRGPLTCSISESLLEMPNAFSPNGDGHNDKYCAKKYQSLVEFRATIFNRWGQKIYEWTDPAGGWDGTFNGHDVREGVYFVVVKARGADGLKFNIRKDVNLLRGYTETSSSGGNP